MSLRFKIFKDVCKWSCIQLCQILKFKLQFTSNFQDNSMCDVAHAEVNKRSDLEKYVSAPYSVTYDTFCAIQCNIWHLKLFQTWILCHIKMLCSSALCWKSPQECLATGGLSWNNYEFLHMSCICQPLQVLYIDPCLLKM